MGQVREAAHRRCYPPRTNDGAVANRGDWATRHREKRQVPQPFLASLFRLDPRL